jgi:hypothetical protein
LTEFGNFLGTVKMFCPMRQISSVAVKMFCMQSRCPAIRKKISFGPTTTQSIRYESYGCQMPCSSQNVLRVGVGEERKAGWRGGLYLGLGDVRDASCLTRTGPWITKRKDGCDTLQASCAIFCLRVTPRFRVQTQYPWRSCIATGMLLPCAAAG